MNVLEAYPTVSVNTCSPTVFTRRTVTGIVLMATLTGCSQGVDPELVPVRGTLTLDASPAAMKDVTFVPESGTPGSGASGRTQADGTFELVAIVGGATRVMKGARPGGYRVVVAQPELYDLNGTPQPLPPDVKAMQIPAVYSGFDSTPLRVEVTEGMSDVVLELSSKKR